MVHREERKEGYKVEFIYIFNDWFKREEYKDTKQYILEMGCQYFFYQVPLSVIGLDCILSAQQSSPK